MTNFVGKVNVEIYFGTKYDYFNVPFSTPSITLEATKTITCDAQVVWQTTYLNVIRINIKDYQDIVGAQYVKMFDIGTDDHGAHWFNVLGYQQVSRKCVELGLLYDPILSIGIHHITGISGTMRRWTVNDDTPYKYTSSPEPIDQLGVYEYSYYRYSCVKNLAAGNSNVLVGFPYNMNDKPEIARYINQNEEVTQIYYPKLNETKSTTSFSTTFGGQVNYNDGLLYYDWDTSNEARKNYNYAIGLGYDLVSSAYLLPSSDLITVNKSVNGISAIAGLSAIWNTGAPLKETSKNSKAGEIGRFLTLYNECTGDSVTVNNYQLNNSAVTVFANPYITGSFIARFSSYLKDNNGYSGAVNSCGYMPITLTSTTNKGANMVNMQTAMANDALTVEQRTQAVNYQQQRRYADLRASENLLYATAEAVADVAIAVTSRSPQGVTSAIRSSANFGASLIANTGEFIQNYQFYNAMIESLNTRITQQKQMLSVNGTLGQYAPPTCKYANATMFSEAAYTMCVRLSKLSNADKERADTFFTKYGYNVNGEMLNSIEQLKCRNKFTFIMADDVEITSVSDGTDLTRLRDKQTVEFIKDRFSSGLRIWMIEPDYNYNEENPIKE